MTNKKLFHAPVLAEAVLDHLITEETTVFFDGTLGLGGHAAFILERAPQIKTYIATDLDEQHLAFATEHLAPWRNKLQLHQGNFSTLADLLPLNSDETISVLLDLGLCSNQVDDADKGFSFRLDGPLHMAFATKSDVTAASVLETASAADITDMLHRYGEEPAAHKISRAIIDRRQHQPLRTTRELVELVEGVVHPKDRKKAVTRVFQALRIAVNDELGHLEKALLAFDQLRSGDRFGIITYHSLEDRIVKQYFKQQSKPITEATDFSLHTEIAPAPGQLVNRKPIVPTADEIEANPRARSAKLRIIEKN